MQRPQQAGPRARSPFAAAFLSLIFPGLGQLYAGAPMRALAFAAAPILLIALGAGVFLRMDRMDLLGLVFNPFLLTSIFVVNLLVLGYRIIAVVDAYRVAEFLNAHDAGQGRGLGAARIARHPLSLAGLLAIILIMAGSHVAVARYDMLAIDFVSSGCVFVGDDNAECDEDPDASPDATETPEATETPDASAAPTDTPLPETTADGSAVPQVSIPPWDGKKRLNILLIGADTQGGGHNTDTLITVSIDPVTKQVAMFSLPRDTVDVPIPAGPAQRLWGTKYSQKINSFFVQNRRRSDLWPGKDSVRGYNALKATLGELYGIDIRYFVEVDFTGFRKVIDELGGVTINVQVPVLDDHFPAADGADRRLYIPSGLQHMSGAEALRYARSRHTTNDFDRSARQQRVLLSLRQQADPQDLLPRLPGLISALKKSVKTDIPLDQFDELLGLASQVDTENIRSYVFSPPLYSQDTCRDSRGCVVLPKIAQMRSAVKNAFKADPADEALREKLAEEGGQVWVVSGLADRAVGSNLARYLEYRGLAASAPRAKPEGAIPAHTVITVYNGAEEELGDTIAYLEKTFKVKAELVTDPAIRADVIVTIGRDTPELEAPPLS